MAREKECEPPAQPVSDTETRVPFGTTADAPRGLQLYVPFSIKRALNTVTRLAVLVWHSSNTLVGPWAVANMASATNAKAAKKSDEKILFSTHRVRIVAL